MKNKPSKEFWGTYDLLSESKDIVKIVVNGPVKNSSLPEPWSYITDLVARQSLLTQLLATDKECTRTTQCKDYAKNGLQKWYSTNPQGKFQKFLHIRLTKCIVNILSLTPDTFGVPLPDLSIFPRGSWAIQIKFKLKKPYISKDDTDFYIIDNPIKKEWVFKVPYVAPSQWKGTLRSAIRKLKGYDKWEDERKDENNQMIRLFGNIKGESEEFSRGSLYFFPTYFDRIGLEVINPHSRDTGAGKQPIYFECVPVGTEGVFTVLYVPQSGIDEETSKKDLEITAQGIKAMLTEYGFGAKTSSGYGVAELSYTSQKSIIVEPREYENIVSKIWED